MTPEIAAVQRRLASVLGVRVVVGDARDVPAPYVVVWADPAGPGEQAVRGSCGARSVRVGVTVVAEAAEIALRMADDAQQALTPGLDPARLPTEDARHLTVVPAGGRGVVIDRTYTLPGSGTHPAYVVVLVDVESQPLPL